MPEQHSKRQFLGLYDYLTLNDIPDGVNIVFRHQVQPWHPSSVLVHEAALATAIHGGPGRACWFWAYSYLIFERQSDFFDLKVVDETRNQTYQRLVGLFGELFKKDVSRVDEGEAVKELLDMLVVGHERGKRGTMNIGNRVTDDLKLCIKLARQNGIHASPTVVWDGLVERDVESSFGEKEWDLFFEERILGCQKDLSQSDDSLKSVTS